MLFEMFMNLRKMLFDEETNDVGVLIQAGQVFLENVSELTFFYEFNEKPKS